VVADSNGNVIGTPAVRTITVSGSGSSQLTASIISPTNNAVVQVGESVYLAAQAPAVFGLTDIRYRWRIRAQGSSTDLFTSSQLTPGDFVFDRTGSYRIRFRVSGLDPISGNRVSETVRNTITVTDPVVVAAPIISQPPRDLVAALGQTVYFQAANVPGSNLTYRWDFSDNAPDSFSANPPPVTFNQPGTFIVRLRVRGTSINGLPLSLDEQRIISVSGVVPPNPFPGPSPFPSPIPPQPPVGGAASPEGVIDLPNGNKTVRVGTALQFSGRGFDPLGNGQLTFLWSFGGAAPNIASQYPGTLTFNRVGNYVVTLLVVNAFGQIDPTPATVVISVIP
jgi:PKD repeat protein